MALALLGIGLPATAAEQPSSSPANDDLTHAVYSKLIDRYRNGSYRDAAVALSAFPRDALQELNGELPAILDLERTDDARKLRAAVLLNAELVTMAPSVVDSDFYLEESTRLADWFGFEAGTALQRAVHLAVAYRLYDERRIVDALRVLRPAAAHFPEDPELAWLLGRLEELSGWLNASSDDSARAREIYRSALERSIAPDATITLRLARVLTLLGESEAAARVALAQTLQLAGRRAEASAALEAYLALGGGMAGGDCFQRYLMSDASRHFALWRALREAVR